MWKTIKQNDSILLKSTARCNRGHTAVGLQEDSLHFNIMHTHFLNSLTLIEMEHRWCCMRLVGGESVCIVLEGRRPELLDQLTSHTLTSAMQAVWKN